MKIILELLSDWRDFLINNFDHINSNRNPFFIVFSLIIGVLLIIVGIKLKEKNILEKVCIILGAFVCLFSIVQLIYKTYI